MKKLLSASIAAATIAGFAAPAAAVEGLSANAGFMSDYYFRGVQLGESTAYAGVDYEVGGFYVGAWAADDDGTIRGGNDGLEVDYYLGYGMAHNDDISWSVGATNYTYTYTHDSEIELNLGVSLYGVGIDLALGQDLNPEDGSGGADDNDNDYTFLSISYGYEAYGVVLGHMVTDESDLKDPETDRTYFEVSASGEVSGLDMGATLGKELSSNVDGDEVDNSDWYLALDISKSFDL